MAKTSLLYIATQNPEKMGITAAEFDPATGALSVPRLVIETRDPSHFTLSVDHKHLYTCNSGTPGWCQCVRGHRHPERRAQVSQLQGIQGARA